MGVPVSTCVGMFQGGFIFVRGSGGRAGVERFLFLAGVAVLTLVHNPHHRKNHALQKKGLNCHAREPLARPQHQPLPPRVLHEHLGDAADEHGHRPALEQAHKVVAGGRARAEPRDDVAPEGDVEDAVGGEGVDGEVRPDRLWWVFLMAGQRRGEEAGGRGVSVGSDENKNDEKQQIIQTHLAHGPGD